MRVWMLCSDWKWTGPAEPMLLLARALRGRGHRVELAIAAPPGDASRHLLGEARSVGLAPRLVLAGGRGLVGAGAARDLRALRAHARREPPDLVHVWHSRDHALALGLARSPAWGRGPGRPAVVRSLASAEPLAASPWNRWLFGPGCDGLLSPGRRAAALHARLRGGRPGRAVLGAVDAARFAAADGGPVRRRLGIAAAAPVIGVVARTQRHRRFDLLFEAFARLRARRPDARLLLLGRGTHYDEVVREPVRRLGLSEAVVEAGYRVDDYPAALAAMDVFTLLVPGSDPSCRALLEAMAAGVPTVSTRRGALPELVGEGETGGGERGRGEAGLLVDEEPGALLEGWLALLEAPERRRALGRAARRRARLRFAPERLAAEVEALYAELAPPLGVAPSDRAPAPRDGSSRVSSSR